MAREHWTTVLNGPKGLSCARGVVERTFLAIPPALCHEDRLHLQDLMIDVENAEGCRTGLGLTQVNQADRAKEDSLATAGSEVLKRVMRASC